MSGVDLGTARLVAGGLPTPDAVEVGLTALEAMSLSAAGDTITRLCDEVAHRGDLIRVLADALTHWVEELDRDPCRTESGAVDVFAYLIADAEQVARLAAILDVEDGEL